MVIYVLSLFLFFLWSAKKSCNPDVNDNLFGSEFDLFLNDESEGSSLAETQF